MLLRINIAFYLKLYAFAYKYRVFVRSYMLLRIKSLLKLILYLVGLPNKKVWKLVLISDQDTASPRH